MHARFGKSSERASCPTESTPRPRRSRELESKMSDGRITKHEERYMRHLRHLRESVCAQAREDILQSVEKDLEEAAILEIKARRGRRGRR